MAPAMSEAASPIGIANVSLVSCIAVPEAVADMHHLDIASKSKVSDLLFPICHNSASTDLTPGTRSLLNVELRSPSWYLSAFPVYRF